MPLNNKSVHKHNSCISPNLSSKSKNMNVMYKPTSLGWSLRLSDWHSTSVILLSYPSCWQSQTLGHCQRADNNLHRSRCRVPLHPPSLSRWTRKISGRTDSDSAWSTSADYSAPLPASHSLLKVHSVAPPGLLKPLRISPVSCPLGKPSCLPRNREWKDYKHSLEPKNELKKYLMSEL